MKEINMNTENQNRMIVAAVGSCASVAIQLEYISGLIKQAGPNLKDAPPELEPDKVRQLFEAFLAFNTKLSELESTY